MSAVRKYTLIYGEYLRNGLATAMAYRLHFVLVIVMDWFFYGTSLATVDFLYDQVPRIGTWPREQFLFFVAFMLAVDQLHMTFISENFWNFSGDLRTGKLDLTLVKPVNAFFASFLSFVRAPSLLNLPIPWFFVIHYGMAAGLSWQSWVLVGPLVLLALTLQVSLELLMCMSMFLTVESFGINFLRMQLQQLSRWPDFVFRGGTRYLFATLIPVLLIGTPPVRLLFAPGSYGLLLPMFAALVPIWLATHWAWRRGLRSYESASS